MASGLIHLNNSTWSNFVGYSEQVLSWAMCRYRIRQRLYAEARESLLARSVELRFQPLRHHDSEEEVLIEFLRWIELDF